MHIVLSFVEKRNWVLGILLHFASFEEYFSLIGPGVCNKSNSQTPSEERIFGDNVSHSFEGKNAEVG